MKKFNFFSIAFLLCAFCAIAQKPKTDWEKMKLKGKVKSISEIEFKLTEKFGELKKEQTKYHDDLIFSPAGYVTKEEYNFGFEITAINKYDDKGNLIDKSNYEAGNLSDKIIFKYDDKRNLIEQNRYDKNGDLELKIINKYDTKGNVIETSQYDQRGNSKGKTINKYNIKGDLIEQIEYYDDGQLSNKLLNIYDDKGKLIEMTETSTDGSSRNGNEKTVYSYRTKKTVNKYDIKGNLIEQNRSFGDFKRITYKYNDKGDLIEKNYFSTGVNPYKTESYQIEYDQNLNWIKSYLMPSKGDESRGKERVIEYL